ncbi:ABC transporter ATP-binding protein [Azospirillum halopraeferens]|uniref:ABC transporter ATP-binding protein n=1 Tax=Azospirillum halopraeferens TaxID=34010 RepID=UPI0006841323|nr:ABC transporter ATP-binding protein [Azospirillum halopraeferens]
MHEDRPDTAPGAGPVLELAGVRKTFDGFVAVERIDLQVAEGEFFTIVGPSGSGKTTLLRMLAGMEHPTEGDIIVRGRSVRHLPPNKRPTCLVFQSLALFPHRTVGENIEFPLKMRKVPPADRRVRALELMRMVRLPEGYYAKNVTKCSGGERQRVALARALAYDPEILLFDEPLSAIDYKLRKTLEKELKDLHKETGKTFIYITHSLEEAMVMSDRIGVMRGGRLVQVGTPEDIYTRPTDRFVCEFMGEVNVLPVVAADGAYVCAGLTGRFTPPPGGPQPPKGFIVVRPEFLHFVEDDDTTTENVIVGTIYNEYSLGSRMQYQVRVGDKTFIVEQSRRHACSGAPDRPVRIGWHARDAIFVAE